MKRKEIRIVDPTTEVWKEVNKRATKEKRTIGKQAEYMISEFLDFDLSEIVRSLDECSGAVLDEFGEDDQRYIRAKELLKKINK